MKDNHKLLKRFLAFVLSAAMIITYMPVSMIAFAEDDTAQPAAEEVVDTAAPADADASVAQDEVKTEEPAPVQEETSEPAPATEEQTPAPAEEQQVEDPVDDPEVVDSVPDDTVKYPAKDYTGAAGGVSVLVSAPEGALPEGTEMKVQAVTTSEVIDAISQAVDGEVKQVKAVDITFYKDDKEIQPQKDVVVKLTTSTMKAADDYSVVHVADNGVAETVADADVSAAGAEFEAGSFSVYAVVGTGETGDEARATVNFISKGTTLSTVYVKNSDTAEELEKIVYDPGEGEVADNELFKGWTTDPNYTSETKPMTIADIRTELEAKEIKEGDVVNYYAVIFKTYHVSFKDEDGVAIHSENLFLASSETEVDYTINVPYTPKSQDSQFQGWNVLSGEENVSGTAPYTNPTNVKISGNVTFGANAPEGRWLVFVENGSNVSYTAPQFVKTGDTTTKPADPTRVGYDFKGWNTKADGTGEAFTFRQTLSERTTLYAQWEAKAKADYTVLIWKQSASDAKNAADSAKTYDFAEAITIEDASTSQPASAVTSSGSGNNAYATVNGTAKKYTGFHLNKYDQNVEVKPDGTTVVNVYYDRNLVTLTFQYRSNGRWETQETMTGLYGSTLASNGYKWPTNRWWYDSYQQNWGGGYSGDGTRTTFLDAFILSDGGNEQTFYGFDGSGDNHVYFYKKNADTGDYELANEVETSGGTFHISDKYNGYKAVEYSTNNRTWTELGDKDSDGYYASVRNFTNLYIRFDPLEYNLLYKNGKFVDGDGQTVDEAHTPDVPKTVEGILFESDMSAYNKGGAKYFTPTAPAGFVFGGWYADESCTQEFKFTTMPEGLTVYAKWVQKQYRVFMHPNVPTSDESLDWGGQSMCFRVDYNQKVADGNKIIGTRDDYELIGWYTDEACTQSFNFDAFTLNDSTVTTPYDQTQSTELDKYGNPTENTNKDKVNNRTWITTKLDLYASWRSKLPGAKGIDIVYDPVDGSNAPTDSNQYLDRAEAVAQGASTAPEGKVFAYWVLQTWNGKEYVDTDTKVYPGGTFTVLKSDAKQEIQEQDAATGEITKATYTVQLRAEYVPGDEPTPTHIHWYANNGTEDVVEDEPLQINWAVDIKPANTFTYADHVFLGWAKSADATEPWLVYDKDRDSFTCNGNTVTQVAADERQPYDDLYAIWAAEVKVVIKGSEKTEKYNGATQTNSDYTVEYYVGGKKVKSLPDGVTFTPGTATPATGKDVGKYSQKVTGTLASTSKLYVIPADGGVTSGDVVLEITKRTVKLTSADGEKVYDGTALTNNKVTVGGDGFVTGEGATYDVTGTQTEVGSSANAFTYTLNEGTKADNYTITTDPGTLTVTPVTDKVTVTITENSGSEKYDGAEKTVTGYTVSIDNELYTESDFTFSGDATVTGTDAGSYPMELTAEDFTNTSENFSNVEFVIVDGTLEIAKREVTLTSATASKTYDGTALTNDTVTVGGDGFVNGEGATYDVTGTQTEAGSSPNAFTYTLNEGTKAGNYEITKTEGTLTVTADAKEVVVTITENSGSEKYDGGEKTVTGYTVTSISSTLYTEADFEFTGDATVKGTDAGTYNMELKPKDFTNKNGNFTSVTFVIVDGTLKIAKREVTLTSADDEKVYDGTALTNDTVTVGGDGFAEGEGATYNVTGSQTEAGDSQNTFTYTLNEGTKADNYTITTVPGTLTVTPVTDKVTVTITENSGSEKYDGAEKKAEGYTVSIDNELYTENDFTFSGDATVTGTDAGSYPMELTAEDFTNTSENFTNVEFVIVDGTLDIAKREVTLTSATDSKTYDGTALTNDEVTVSGDGFAEGEGATYDVTGSQTEKGSSANAFTYELNEGTKADNYDITKTEGTLTVTALTDKVTVTITENSGSEKYDGTEKTVEGYTVSIDNELYTESDFTFSGDATVTGTDAGSYPMLLKPADFTNTNTNFTNVTFVIVDGTLEIAKREVTLTSATDSKTYDGTPLTNDEVTVGGDGFAKGEGATYDVTGTQTNAGSSANAFTYTLNEGTKADNYTITKTEGTLTVTPVTDKVTVTITENSGSEKYDGEEKTVTGYTTDIDNELYTTADFTFSGDATVKGTDAGTYDMELKAADFTNTSKNFTNVEFVIVDGTLEIAKREVTLTSADDEKVYDGQPLTNSTVSVTGDGFADGEGAAYDVTGTQTNAGSSANAFTYTLNEGTKADNYDITKTEGTLTVKPVEEKVTVTITENSGEGKYDGTEQIVEGYTTEIDNILYTEEDFEFSGDATIVGTNAGTYDMELKPADFKNISENFTNVEFVIVDGQLEIGKRAVTLTSLSAEKVYDGKPLTKHEVEIGGEDGFAEGEGLDSVDVTGTQTYVGESANTFTYKLYKTSLLSKLINSDDYDPDAEGVYKNTSEENYDITTEEGTLTVTDEDENGDHPDGVVTKTHDGEKYSVGDIIEFTIEVKNIYDEEKTITISEQEGVTITGDSVFEGVAPGETVTTTAEYEVTKKDVKAGKFKNRATVRFSGVDKPYYGDDVVDSFEKDSDKDKGVKTGDDNNLMGWLALMLLAGAGGSGLLIKRRREDD